MARFFSRRRRGGGVGASKPKTQKNKNNAKIDNKKIKIIYLVLKALLKELLRDSLTK